MATAVAKLKSATSSSFIARPQMKKARTMGALLVLKTQVSPARQNLLDDVEESVSEASDFEEGGQTKSSKGSKASQRECEEEAPPPTCLDRVKRIVVILILIALVLGGVKCHQEVKQALDKLVDYCKVLGWGAPVVVTAAVAALNLFMLPTFPLMVGAGVIFPHIFGYVMGQVVGVMSVFAGMWIGSMITFILGRRCFKEWAEEELQKFAWMHVVNDMINEQGAWVVLLARMSPLLPAEVFNYACSLTSLSVPSFGIGCLGSVVPTCMWVCSSASAASAVDADSGNESPQEKRRSSRLKLLFMVLNVAFLLMLTFLLYISVQRYKARALKHVHTHIQARCDDWHAASGREMSEDKVRRITQQLETDIVRMTRFRRRRNRKGALNRAQTHSFAGDPGRRATT